MKRLTVFLPVVLLMAIGCDMNKVDPGGGASSPSVVSLRGAAGPTGIDVVPPDPPDVVTGGPPGTLVGRIVLDGATPSLAAKIAKGTSPVDKTICAAQDAIPDQSFEVSADGGVANVFIYLARSPQGEFEPKESQTVLDQAACIFKPHALIWRTGTPFELKNSDKASHNVEMATGSNGSSNSTMTPNSSSMITFDKPEVKPFQAKCAIHPWMSFYALVVDHPYAAVTDENGRFEIPELASGVEHDFRVWHERGANRGMLNKKWSVTVKPGPDVIDQDLHFAPSDFGF